jgi:hypothetical protein
MEINIKHTDYYGSGKYILNEEKALFTVFQDSTEIFLTQEDNFSLKNEILKLIEDAQKAIKICSFIITDKDVYNALLDKAQNSNVAIFILTQLDQKKLTNIYSLTDSLTEEERNEKSAQTHLKYIKKLFESGIHIRAAVSIHAKFIISDRKIGFITSANITTPSLNLNTESGVYLEDQDVNVLDNLFDTIFLKGATYRQFLSSSKKNKIFVVQSENTIDQKILPHTSNLGLRYTYEDLANNLYEEILEIIDKSTEYLYLSTYSIVKLTNLKEFTKAIKEAISRGVKINIFCRGMNHRNDHLEGSEILKSLGCNIFADLYNHSKGIINQDSGLIFTANIDGNYGLKNGFEIGYILNENQRKEFLKFHKYLIKTAYYVYENKPLRNKVFQTYIKFEMDKKISSPAFENDLVISVGRELKVIENKIKNHLLFYGKKGNDEFLILGGSFYRCKINGNVFQIISTEDPCYDLAIYLLKYINLKIIFN